MEKNGTPRFTGYGPRQQRLPGTRRPHKQHPGWHFSAQTGEPGRLSEEFDRFQKFGFCLLCAGHIAKKYFCL